MSEELSLRTSRTEAVHYQGYRICNRLIDHRFAFMLHCQPLPLFLLLQEQGQSERILDLRGQADLSFLFAQLRALTCASPCTIRTTCETPSSTLWMLAEFIRVGRSSLVVLAGNCAEFARELRHVGRCANDALHSGFAAKWSHLRIKKCSTGTAGWRHFCI